MKIDGSTDSINGKLSGNRKGKVKSLDKLKLKPAIVPNYDKNMKILLKIRRNLESDFNQESNNKKE